jgi:hypothetical protein
LSKILDTPPVGVGAGAGVGTGVPAEAARRQQAEVAAVKLVRVLPYRSLYNPIN